jgi:hypothetical protein
MRVTVAGQARIVCVAASAVPRPSSSPVSSPARNVAAATAENFMRTPYGGSERPEGQSEEQVPY